MMNLTELKKMLQKDFNVKYLSDLEQIELVQNNEDLHIGIVKVELKVAYKYYTIGTFGVLNKNAKVDGRKIKASMTYLNKIATWFADVQEVDVKIFIDDEYQTTKKVKQVELLTIQEPTQAIEKVACEVEPTIKEETQEPTKKAQTKKVMEVIKNQLSNIKEVTTKNEHYYKIHLDNNYMITAFYSNCAKCYKVTLFDMSKSPKNGENKVVHTLKLQDLTNFKEVYNFWQIVEKQIQEQPTTKESCKTVEPQTIKKETQEPTQAIEKVACEVEEKQVFTQEPLPYKEWCELEFKKWHNEFELLIKGMLETLDGELCNISYSDVFGISINYFWNETTVSKIKETKDFIINTFHAKYTDYLASSLIPLLSEYRDDSLLQISEISRQLFVNVVDLCEEIGFNDMESFTSEEHYKEYLNNFNTSN